MKCVFGFRVRLEIRNPHFENLNPDFPIERTLKVDNDKLNDNITVSLTYLESSKYKTNHLPIVNDGEEEFWAEGEKRHLLRKSLLSIAFNGRKWTLPVVCLMYYWLLLCNNRSLIWKCWLIHRGSQKETFTHFSREKYSVYRRKKRKKLERVTGLIAWVTCREDPRDGADESKKAFRLLSHGLVIWIWH